MKTNEIEKVLDKYGLDKDFVVSTLKDIEYKYVQYTISESIEEQAHVHPNVPEELFCINSIIKVIEGK